MGMHKRPLRDPTSDTCGYPQSCYSVRAAFIYIIGRGGFVDETPLLRQWIVLRTLCARHYGVTLAELAAERGVSEKTIRRDLETFRQAGFPLLETTEDHGRKKWQIDTTKYQPGLAFAFDEAIALYLARHLVEPLAGTPLPPKDGTFTSAPTIRAEANLAPACGSRARSNCGPTGMACAARPMWSSSTAPLRHPLSPRRSSSSSINGAVPSPAATRNSACNSVRRPSAWKKCSARTSTRGPFSSGQHAIATKFLSIRPFATVPCGRSPISTNLSATAVRPRPATPRNAAAAPYEISAYPRPSVLGLQQYATWPRSSTKQTPNASISFPQALAFTVAP